jgi:hypothetical protein
VRGEPVAADTHAEVVVEHPHHSLVVLAELESSWVCRQTSSSSLAMSCDPRSCSHRSDSAATPYRQTP